MLPSVGFVSAVQQNESAIRIHITSVSSVAQSCPTLCDPMACSTPSFPVHHQPPELAPTHANPVGEAIQPSHPLVSPSPPAFSLSQSSNIELHKCYAVSRVQLVSGLAIAVAVALPLAFNSANIN